VTRWFYAPPIRVVACAGTSSPFLSVRPICRGLQIDLSVSLLFPPPACISLIAVTCFNWPINQIVFVECAQSVADAGFNYRFMIAKSF
jgi:hypothetical protein